MDNPEIEQLRSELEILKEWIKANSRRLDDLEASAFFLEDFEEVVLVTVPGKCERKHT